MKKNEIDDILKKIKRGTDEIIPIEELKKKLESGKKLKIKMGIDPTMPNLHLGHTILINKLKVFQDLGHHVIFLIGDFTAKIGDPSGRSETRKFMSDEQIKLNVENFANQIFKILDHNKTEITYNSKWFKKFKIDKLLNLVTKSTVAQMLVRDDFKIRYKNNRSISIVEFLYPLFQAYDSVVLKADIELGGSDQKFNLLLGRKIQKDYGFNDLQVIITMPLLEGTDGVKKMSKSYNNYISLSDSPKNIFGKIMSIKDELMYRYYDFLTQIDLNIIRNMHPKEAKSALALEIVEKYYTKEIALKAKEEFNRIFASKNAPNKIEKYYVVDVNIKLSDLLFQSGMVFSKSEAKRLIIQGGVKINLKKIKKDFIVRFKNSFILQIGKRKFIKMLKKEV
ncbi:MAG: tyrosine--tRNA ligase [Endomicrobium sp.]|jgi:tyrosyl-tRNA synthetase|nr:tyrosine--tRNA ligase [Endomicrobium sp.]